MFNFFFIILLFRATPAAHGGSQARGRIRATAASLHHSHSQQHRIRAASATHTTAHGNAGSLTHGARPGIEPTTSWVLVGRVSTAPRRALGRPSPRGPAGRGPPSRGRASVLLRRHSGHLPGGTSRRTLRWTGGLRPQTVASLETASHNSREDCRIRFLGPRPRDTGVSVTVFGRLFRLPSRIPVHRRELPRLPRDLFASCRSRNLLVFLRLFLFSSDLIIFKFADSSAH